MKPALSKFEALDSYSRRAIILGIVGFSTLFVVLGYRYPETERLANEFASAPECGEAPVFTSDLRHSALCTFETRKVVELIRTSGRSHSYFIVLQDDRGVNSKVELAYLNKDESSKLWKGLHNGDEIYVQIFHGSIVNLSKEFIVGATTGNPEWQLSNLKLGLAMMGGGVLFCGLLIAYFKMTSSE